jgi:hypothetical protein
MHTYHQGLSVAATCKNNNAKIRMRTGARGENEDRAEHGTGTGNNRAALSG